MTFNLFYYEKQKQPPVSLSTLIGMMLYSCQNEEINFNEDVTNQSEISLELVQLGDELEIPYTTKNMSKAFEQVLAHLDPSTSYGKSKFASKSNFAAKAATAKSIEIVPSHYYYRFLPKDSLEYESLVNDTILSVTNIPMHIEVVGDGDVYDDPDITGDETGENFGWLYSVLPYDYNFPTAIQNEQLENLYFAPELDEGKALEKGEVMVKSTKNKTTSDILNVDKNGEVFEYLELEALKLTNNLDEEELSILKFYLPNDDSGISFTFKEATQKGFQMPELILDYDSVMELLNYEGDEITEEGKFAKRRRWGPSGRITVEEGALSQIGSGNNVVGVMGAEVRMRKWGLLVIRKARTDRNGNFHTRSTRTKRVKYAVYFNDSDFVVKAGTYFWNARYRDNTRYKRRGWNKHFSEGGRSHFYSLVQNAAYDYFTRVVPQYGLKKPRFCRISAKYDACGSEHRPEILSNGYWPISDIQVSRNSGRDCIYRQSDGIYATTVHELTHAGHREMDAGMFNIFASGSCTRDFLTESWAEGVETIVTNDRYLALDRRYFNSSNDNIGWNFRRQLLTIEQMNEYTPIVADLIDDLNQNNIPNAPGVQPIDRVSGYDLNQIQNALNNCRDIDCWERNLRNNYLNTTENFLPELFNYMRAARVNNNINRCN